MPSALLPQIPLIYANYFSLAPYLFTFYLLPIAHCLLPFAFLYALCSMLYALLPQIPLIYANYFSLAPYLFTFYLLPIAHCLLPFAFLYALCSMPYAICSFAFSIPHFQILILLYA